MMSVLSSEVESVLKLHGIPTRAHVVVLDCEPALAVLTAMCGAEHLTAASSVPEAVRALRSERIVAACTSAESASALVRALNQDNASVGVIALDAPNGESQAAHLRAAGVMDVATEASEAALRPLIRRALDFSALLVLELAHRCESRRLLNRELELLGQPPESMSDDLSVFQPPPLPVGPLSVYNLEEASDAFETAYIDRVQQLCASAREAAEHLGVSSATLSRRMRRETSLDGTQGPAPKI